jgi:hypothetical protein
MGGTILHCPKGCNENRGADFGEGFLVVCSVRIGEGTAAGGRHGGYICDGLGQVC